MSNIHLRPLIVTPEIVARAQAVKAYAFDHRENLTQLRNRMSSGAVAPGDFHEFVLDIPEGYRAVYSINQQPSPLNWCQQISVSVNAPRMMPNPTAVAAILELFDITASRKLPHGVLAEAAGMWEEKVGPATTAINLLYPFDTVAWLKRGQLP